MSENNIGVNTNKLLEEKLIVSENMNRYGGSFVKQMGGLLARADIINTVKIKNTWSELWCKYLKF